MIHHLLPKVTNVVANDNIPEVLHFGKIIHGISEDYYAKSVTDLMRSMEETTDIIRRFIHVSETAGGRQMLSTGSLANYLPIVDEDHVQPLMQSLETLSGIIQDLQDDST